MSLLLDAFEDAGVDRETVAFLVEALQNAEPDDWSAIVEPFLPSDPVVAVLNAEPDVLERTVRALEREAEEAAAEAAKPPPNADSLFLDIFVCGHEHIGEESPCSSSEALPGALAWIDASVLARCHRLCRRAQDLVTLPHVWEPRVRATCALWSLPLPEEPAQGWRSLFFELLRPRCDGIYVGECRYVHHIRPGASWDAKLCTKSYHWVDYRRYLRLLPPDPVDGALRALVLRDVCPFTAAVSALLSVDPKTHVNSLQPETSLEKRAHVSNQAHLQNIVAAGTYTWEADRVEVRFANGGDRYRMVFQLMDGHDMRFSGRLEWAQYNMISKHEEEVPFDLGRSRYGGGEAADSQKDHFPPLLVRQCPQLKHLL
mmetsp:Transcript_685/g.1692  ORF Transcript_685/g.1692 Transcript_685/m.1692 type:complete len:372 (-) Transcript_685:115-1230(-)